MRLARREPVIWGRANGVPPYRLHVTLELLRQLFGVELPITGIQWGDDDETMWFYFGDSHPQTQTKQLSGRFPGHYCDGEQWYRAEFEVIEASG